MLAYTILVMLPLIMSHVCMTFTLCRHVKSDSFHIDPDIYNLRGGGGEYFLFSCENLTTLPFLWGLKKMCTRKKEKGRNSVHILS